MNETKTIFDHWKKGLEVTEIIEKLIHDHETRERRSLEQGKNLHSVIHSKQKRSQTVPMETELSQEHDTPQNRGRPRPASDVTRNVPARIQREISRPRLVDRCAIL